MLTASWIRILLILSFWAGINQVRCSWWHRNYYSQGQRNSTVVNLGQPWIPHIVTRALQGINPEHEARSNSKANVAKYPTEPNPPKNHYYHDYIDLLEEVKLFLNTKVLLVILIILYTFILWIICLFSSGIVIANAVN